MKKGLKIFLKIMPIVLVAVILVGNVFGIAVVDPAAGAASSTVTGVAGKVWGTVVAIVQILAIAAIVIAGLRYMFASADEKGNIKKQTVTLLVGAVLVFAAFPIADLVSKAATDILK